MSTPHSSPSADQYADNVALHLAKRRARWVSAFVGGGVLAGSSAFLYFTQWSQVWIAEVIALVAVAEVVWGVISLRIDRQGGLPDGRVPPRDGSLFRGTHSLGWLIAWQTAALAGLWAMGSALPSDPDPSSFHGLPLVAAYLASLGNTIPPLLYRRDRERILNEYLLSHPQQATEFARSQQSGALPAATPTTEAGGPSAPHG